MDRQVTPGARRRRILQAHLNGATAAGDRSGLDRAALAAVRVVPWWCGAEVVVWASGVLTGVGFSDQTVAGWAAGREVAAEPAVLALLRHGVEVREAVAGGPVAAWCTALAGATPVERVQLVTPHPGLDLTAGLLVYLRRGVAAARGDAPETLAVDLAAQHLESWALLREVEELTAAIESNRRIGLALGILVERLRITDTHAFSLLRKASQQRNVKLRDIAEQVVLTGSLDGLLP